MSSAACNARKHSSTAHNIHSQAVFPKGCSLAFCMPKSILSTERRGKPLTQGYFTLYNKYEACD